jgi:hypothetical protein
MVMAKLACSVTYAILVGACALPEVSGYVSPAEQAQSASSNQAPAMSNEVGPMTPAASDAGVAGAAGRADVAGSSAPATVAGAGGMSGGACACSTVSACCDGCAIKPGQCFALDRCFREGESAENYGCLYCDPGRSQEKLSTRPAETPCDDGRFCNGGDVCDANGQCSGHGVEPPCSYETCQSCDETADTCGTSLSQHFDEQAQLVWAGGGPQTWQAASVQCQSLETCERDDWQLPSIDTLRKVIRGCPTSQPGGGCRVTDSCLADSCEEGCGGCGEGTGPSLGKYVPRELAPGNGGVIWSTSVSTGHPDTVWSLDASSGAIVRQSKTATGSTLCVRRVK